MQAANQELTRLEAARRRTVARLPAAAHQPRRGPLAAGKLAAPDAVEDLANRRLPPRLAAGPVVPLRRLRLPDRLAPPVRPAHRGQPRPRPRARRARPGVAMSASTRAATRRTAAPAASLALPATCAAGRSACPPMAAVAAPIPAPPTAAPAAPTS